MSDLVGNPEDRFSQKEAEIIDAVGDVFSSSGEPLSFNVLVLTVSSGHSINNKKKKMKRRLFLKAPDKTKISNTVDPDETAHKELSHLDQQCLPSIL